MIELPEFKSMRVLCVGDLMLDRFIKGKVNRISPESPIPVINVETIESVPGGAANVSRNVAALGGRCTLIGAIGEDATGGELNDLLSTIDKIKPALVRDSSRPTIEKVRFVAQGQHLLRADYESPREVSSEIVDKLIATIAQQVREADVVILSDYGKGVLCDAVVTATIANAKELGIPVVVDPKSKLLARYAGATVVTPNAKEITIATGIEVLCDADAERAGTRALAEAGVEAILVTRSELGVTLVTKDCQIVHAPASAREVFDVVGAGDTVVAALALCLGAGLAIQPAARIANAAAGVVVAKHGTATVTRSELVDELSRLSRLGSSPSQLKIMSESMAITLRQQWKRDGLTIGFTNGCFDVLHVGHVAILEFAKSRCDRLIVGVNSDASVGRLKGPSRPLNLEGDRAQILGAFGFVDAVVVFDEDTPYELIKHLQPDILVKGSDYTIEEVVGHDIVQRLGGQVLTFWLVPGRSTSSIIERVEKSKGVAI